MTAAKTAVKKAQGYVGNGVALKAQPAVEMAEAHVQEADRIALIREWMRGQIDRVRVQSVDMEKWWDVYAVGPFQEFADYTGPLAPHKVIKLGESATIYAVIYLNDYTKMKDLEGATPCEFLTSFEMIPYSVTVSTGNKHTWTLASGAGLNTTQGGVLEPYNESLFIEAFTFTPMTVGLHEMSITARLGKPGSEAPFGGFASWVVDPDIDILMPGAVHEMPVLFQVYD